MDCSGLASIPGLGESGETQAVADARNPRVHSLLFQGNEGREVGVRLSAGVEEEARWVGVSSGPTAWDVEPPGG